MYAIEIIATTPELYTPLELACSSLNKIQDEFNFRLISERLRPDIYKFHRAQYSTDDAFNFISDLRTKINGKRPYIILVVDGHLFKQGGLSNLFGNHRANEGMAVFTTSTFEKYIKDLTRFCGYYLVRYALSFVAPGLKSHTESYRKNCLFHKKINKIEIQDSLSEGVLCDSCNQEIKKFTSSEEDVAINSLLKVISNNFPYSLIMKGGGVKGLAFAGALSEMEKYFQFNCFAGTSAGAISASLLGAGYNSDDLIKILKKQNFNKFKDSCFPITLYNLMFKKGMYPGKRFQKWLKDLIKVKKPNQVSDVEMKDLKFRTIIYASQIKKGTLPFDSIGAGHDQKVDFAVRCSMAIPYVFFPGSFNGEKVYDGGLRQNFPIKRFMEDNPQQPFIGFYLLSDTESSWFSFLELMNMTVEGEERALVDANRNRIVVIDPSPIDTTDFNLNEDEKDFLVLRGRLAAIAFLKENYPDIQLDQSQISKHESDLRLKEPIVIKRRKRLKVLKWTLRLSIAVAVIAIYLFGSHCYHTYLPYTRSGLFNTLKDRGKLDIVGLIPSGKHSSSIKEWYNNPIGLFKQYKDSSFTEAPIPYNSEQIIIHNTDEKISCFELLIPGMKSQNFSGIIVRIDRDYFNNNFVNVNDDLYEDWTKETENSSTYMFVYRGEQNSIPKLFGPSKN